MPSLRASWPTLRTIPTLRCSQSSAASSASCSPVVEAYRAYTACQAQIAQAEALLGDPELHEIAREEIEQDRARCAELEQQLRVLLLPRDPNDDRNVILEIRTGVGGEESALFAHTLYRMYNMYADAHGWKTEIANLNETELGGVREAEPAHQRAGGLLPPEV